MSTSYIKRVEISKLWGKYDIVWDNLHPDVNILVGINGSGKSTLLKTINALSFLNTKYLKSQLIESAKLYEFQNQNSDIEITVMYHKGIISARNTDNFLQAFISTFDVPTNKSKLRAEESPLLFELRNLILQTGENSFNDYRLKATQSIDKAIEVNNRIDVLFDLINKLFSNTGKKIRIEESNNLFFDTDNGFIFIEQLSAGEKQLLLILFKVFLMEEKPYILLMDEPEISLHISWQQDLIKTIRTLNPNCQLIVATHSPSIFGKGWGDKITFMENLFVK